MEANNNNNNNPTAENQSVDQEMKAFFETMEGVKGLVDSGVTNIPSFFIHPPKPDTTFSSNAPSSLDAKLEIPVIDLKGAFDSSERRRREIVDAMRDAAQTWGFFQITNHGVPIPVMDNMLDAARGFHEQPPELKKAWYSDNEINQKTFDSNTDFKVAPWRDTLAVLFPDGELNPQLIPQVCRNATSEYMECMVQLKEKLSELLSEALGLKRDYLARIQGMEGALIACHYYPPCPQPELTIGATSHTDASFLTILLQDNVDGLQVLHQNQWVDVPYRHGYLTANIGDLLQIVSNDKFKSVTHRVLAGRVGPRVSAACFFVPPAALRDKPYGPAEGLVSVEDPPIYKGTTFHQYYPFFRSSGRDGRIVLPHFRISS